MITITDGPNLQSLLAAVSSRGQLLARFGAYVPEEVAAEAGKDCGGRITFYVPVIGIVADVTDDPALYGSGWRLELDHELWTGEDSSWLPRSYRRSTIVYSTEFGRGAMLLPSEMNGDDPWVEAAYEVILQEEASREP